MISTLGWAAVAWALSNIFVGIWLQRRRPSHPYVNPRRLPKPYVAVLRDRAGVVVMNVLARLFLTRSYRSTLDRAIMDGYSHRAHQRRREMGFVQCVEIDPDGPGSQPSSTETPADATPKP